MVVEWSSGVSVSSVYKCLFSRADIIVVIDERHCLKQETALVSGWFCYNGLNVFILGLCFEEILTKLYKKL